MKWQGVSKAPASSPLRRPESKQFRHPVYNISCRQIPPERVATRQLTPKVRITHAALHRKEIANGIGTDTEQSRR